MRLTWHFPEPVNRELMAYFDESSQPRPFMANFNDGRTKLRLELPSATKRHTFSGYPLCSSHLNEPQMVENYAR